MFSQSIYWLSVHSFWILVCLVLMASNDVQAKQATEDCRSLQFKEPINKKKLEGHVIKSILVTSQLVCELDCFEDDDCASVNFGPLVQDDKHVCELSSSDHEMHPEDLKDQLDFIYRPVLNHCSSSPCPPTHRCQTGFTDKGYQCIAMTGSSGKNKNETDIDECITGDHDCHLNATCGRLCSENWKKINTEPVCFGAEGNRHGSFVIGENGFILTLKLVRKTGSLRCGHGVPASYWGCDVQKYYGDNKLMTVVTYQNKTALTIAEYTRDDHLCGYNYYTYNISGIGVNSPELVFDKLSLPLSVSIGQIFHLWFAEDLLDCYEYDNSGETCADLYAWYT